MSAELGWIEDGDMVSDCGWTQSDDTIAWACFIGFFVVLTTLLSPYYAYVQATYLLRQRARRREHANA